MRVLSLEETKSGYQAVDTDGEVVWETKTDRTYVAAMGYKFLCEFRFGRLDLIGQGSSKHRIGNCTEEYWIAFDSSIKEAERLRLARKFTKIL